MSKPVGEKYTIAVDFDGVLHSYTTPWSSSVYIPDPPIPGAMEWLVEIAEDFNVVIHTTRGLTEEGQIAVMEWIFRRTGLTLPVTAIKPPALVYIDDRAWRFEGKFPSKNDIHNARPWKVNA